MDELWVRQPTGACTRYRDQFTDRSGGIKDTRIGADESGVACSRRILCYAPYNRWALHGLWEMTILHALELRGAEVQYVLCDGLYSDCDQFWMAVEPRPQHACTICQASVTRLVADMGMDFEWLGRYLTTSEGREAKRWKQSLGTEELLAATYGEWRIGEWVRLSIQSHFRSSELDIADGATEHVTRSYLYSGLVACFALDRLLEESRPDVLLLFNGRQSSTRVALELARARGIRVVVHERGPRRETLMLVENANCLSLEPVRWYWQEWGDVPLTADELDAAAGLMADRETGRDTGWKQFTPAPQAASRVLGELGLRVDHPIWVLFTSSDDEVAGDDRRSPFASQVEWIKRTIEHARHNPQIDLIIRVHPNTGSRRSGGVNHVQLEQMSRLAAADLPPNVRVIDPDHEISSYSLMDLCALGLVWVSTVGLELACKGKQVVVAAGNNVSGKSFAHTVEDASTYEELLDSLLVSPPAAVSAQIRRLALRLAYGMFFRLRVDFPLVEMPTPQEGKLRYRSLEALRPGRDAGVDRCTRVILDDEPICPPPTVAQRARGTEDEDAFLAGFGQRRVTVLAFAEELIADAALLDAWARVFGERDDVTLAIHTLDAETPRLVQAVTRAGLAGDAGPDLVAGRFAGDTNLSVNAVFSRIAPINELATVPRYGPESLVELAASV